MHPVNFVHRRAGALHFLGRCKFFSWIKLNFRWGSQKSGREGGSCSRTCWYLNRFLSKFLEILRTFIENFQLSEIIKNVRIWSLVTLCAIWRESCRETKAVSYHRKYFIGAYTRGWIIVIHLNCNIEFNICGDYLAKYAITECTLWRVYTLNIHFLSQIRINRMREKTDLKCNFLIMNTSNKMSIIIKLFHIKDNIFFISYKMQSDKM